MTNENRNLILAMVLSALVLLGWSFFSDKLFPAPVKPAVEASQTTGAVAAPAKVAVQTADAVIRQTARVAIDTPRLKGSINLSGARIDDLVLKDHLVSMEENAAPVRLLAPAGSQGAQFVGFGWSGPVAPPAEAQWTASAQTLTPAQPVTLSWTSPQGVRFEQLLSVDENYLFTVRQRVVNTTAAPVALRPYGFVNRSGRGTDADAFNLHVGPIAVVNGTLQEGDISYDDLDEEGSKHFNTTGGWLGITEKKWLTALIPDQKIPFKANFTSDAGRYQTDWLQADVVIQPGQQLDTTSHLFAGAKEGKLLNEVRDELGAPLFDRALAWGWFWFIAQPIFTLLQWLYGIFGNYALAIVGLTVIVRVLLFPIANKQYSSMAKMRIFAPKMKEIQEKYKHDKQKQQYEIMELYRREKINPLAGCLPILLQIPIFYALYKVLLITVEIRHMPAFGWIKDLSAPDPLTPLNLFGLIPWDPPSIIALGVLPIILGITMWAQFKLNPQPMDEMQAKIFGLMPWLFMFMMAPFAAGLQIYWIVNNLFSIAQQWFLLRKYPVPAPAPAAPAVKGKK